MQSTDQYLLYYLSDPAHKTPDLRRGLKVLKPTNSRFRHQGSGERCGKPAILELVDRNQDCPTRKYSCGSQSADDWSHRRPHRHRFSRRNPASESGQFSPPAKNTSEYYLDRILDMVTIPDTDFRRLHPPGVRKCRRSYRTSKSALSMSMPNISAYVRRSSLQSLLKRSIVVIGARIVN